MKGADIAWTGVQRSEAEASAVVPRVVRSFESLEAPWREIEQQGHGGPFQRYDFYAAWMNHVGRRKGAEPAIVVGERNGRIVYILPLVVVRSGLFRIARFAGDTHANYNTGLIRPCTVGSLTADDAAAAFAAVGAAIPGLDLLHLAGQPATIDGRKNPFVTAASARWAYTAYDIDLSEGFEALLGRHRGSKKRKRERQQARAFQAAGDFRFYRAGSAEEAHRILDCFAEQKAVRFAEQGIPNIFTEPGTMDFFHDVLDRSFAGGPATLEAFALDVAGKTRATFIVAPFGSDLFGLMNSIAVDELTSMSPGDYVNFNLLRDACDRGFRRFDFGIGDARYKRSWVDAEVLLMETLIPVSLWGRLPQLAVRARSVARNAIVARPALYRAAQRLRRMVRRTNAEPARSDDGE
ncbi:GNAT family N-acetyltransferase [Chthonobacter albigriseus]|uniref:GNAT family N-acetyltransferase n=1 Tax=Chthonobacter albigriseus TaxID=1683161 RepID=UPI0015EFCBD8|nr:GNAT family N-acetyltransferase [Chthonobacter albigriseus]